MPHLPLLQVKNLSVNFSGENGITPATREISFSVNKGEILGIVGESGSGKSVTALSILQLLPVSQTIYSSGEILFSADGLGCVDLLKQKPGEIQTLRGNRIAMIFQEPMSSLNPVFTCGSQVIEAILHHQKLSYKEAKKQTIALFEQMQLPEPSTIFDRYPHQLSGGQKQRVMIAMAMSCNPDLLICDEPTTALDVTVQQTILQLIKDLQRKRGMAVVFITHDLGIVSEIADRALVMYRGEVMEQGLTTDLFSRPRHPYTRGLLQCRPALHQKGERLPQVSDFLTTSETLPVPESRKPLEKFSDRTLSVPSSFEVPLTPCVEVQGLCVSYSVKPRWFRKTAPGHKAIDDISFNIYKNETLGLVGESGCGKTTLGRALVGLLKPSSGHILVEGQNLLSGSHEDQKKWRKNLQLIFQDPFSSLNPRITIGAAIEEALRFHRILPSRKQQSEKVVELLEMVGLKAEHAQRYPHEFSGGQRQRVVIARALSVEPSLIVCDESVSALDVSVQAQVLNLLNDLKNRIGFTAVFISHDLSVVQYMSDRIMVMNRGKMEEIGSAEKINNHPEKAYTRKLLAAIPKPSFEVGN